LLLLLVLVSSVDGLVGVGDVEEVVFFVVLLVERPHGGRGGRDHVVDEKEEGVLGPQRHTLADQEVELAHRQVRRHQILLLVELGDPGLGRPLDDDGHAVGVLPPDLLALRLPLLEGVLFLVLPLHLAGDVLELLKSGLFWFSCDPLGRWIFERKTWERATGSVERNLQDIRTLLTLSIDLAKDDEMQA